MYSARPVSFKHVLGRLVAGLHTRARITPPAHYC